MAADLQVVYDHLAAFSVFSVLIFVLTLLAIRKRKFGIGSLRLLSVIPYAISAALAINLYHSIRDRRFPTDYQPQLNRLHATYGILAIVGIFATSCTFLMWIILCVLKARSERKGKDKLLGRHQSSAYFYILVADMAIAGCLIAGVALSSTFVPWNMNRCEGEDYRLSPLISGIRVATVDENNRAACRRGITIHVMGAATVVLIIIQDILMFPLVNLPNGIRFVIFVTIRLIRQPGFRPTDIERRETDETSDTLTQEISNQIEKHPHYSDLIGVLKESKGITTSGHFEMLAEKCCRKGKSECWACDGVICNDCKAVKQGEIKSPRTTHHITGCYAICTGCYLIKGSSQPAAFSATLNPTNLSLQHHGCSRTESGVINDPVELCSACAKLSPDDISRVREDKEQALLSKTLLRRILCSMCEKPMPRGTRRWWICGWGDHECHWAGHEVVR